MMLERSTELDERPIVLLVEDNLVDAEWAKRALRGNDEGATRINVEHVDRLLAALKRLENKDVQLVVLDLRLPDVDNEVASVERIHELNPDIPIVVYSGASYEKSGLAAIERGALYFFPKSSNDRRWFARTVRHALDRYQMQQSLRRIIETNTDGMAVFSRNGRLMFANRAAQEIFSIEGGAEQSFEAPFALGDVMPAEVRIGPTSVELRSVEVDWFGTTAKLVTLRDITQRQRMEQQLRQAQKMEAIGLLAGGLAHDLNNILTVIAGYADMVIDNLPAASPLRADIGEIQLAGERASTLIRQLLTFSRADDSTADLISPDYVIRETHTLLRRLIAEDIDFFVNTGCENKRVRLDRSQLEQVIINLVVNARDAMPAGGKISIESRFAIPDELAGDCVVIVVTDTGEGMDEYTMAHMFEPFFTTKGAERGTGLGLATTYSIVNKCGGTIRVDSAPGSGTVFRIYLPCDDSSDAVADDMAEQQVTKGGNETILLVEDEPSVRRLAALILRGKGYTVIEAEAPDVALDLIAGEQVKLDLVVTDIVMPGMNARELMERLHERFPNLEALYLSGYSLDALLGRGILEPDQAFLQKPFSPSQLSERVRRTLDEGVGAMVANHK